MNFNFSPYIFEIYGFGLRYYSLMYLIGFLVVYVWMSSRKKYSADLISDFCFGGIFSVIFGGRIGYFLFYEPGIFLSDPLEFFKLWHGGLSFHGGMFAVLLWVVYFCRKHAVSFLSFGDDLAIPGIFATGLGRLGNFFNGEIWGRATDSSWCFFVSGLSGCRHPAQLYQMLSDWTVALLLLIISRSSPKNGTLSGLFLVGYSLSRISNEIFFREPDWIFLNISAGIWLSLPLLILGLILLAATRYRCNEALKNAHRNQE